VGGVGSHVPATHCYTARLQYTASYCDTYHRRTSSCTCLCVRGVGVTSPQHTATLQHCNAAKLHTAAHCITLHHTLPKNKFSSVCVREIRGVSLPHPATHCNTNTLHYTETHIATERVRAPFLRSRRGVMSAHSLVFRGHGLLQELRRQQRQECEW